jgi:hypothetical protein
LSSQIFRPRPRSWSLSKIAHKNRIEARAHTVTQPVVSYGKYDFALDAVVGHSVRLNFVDFERTWIGKAVTLTQIFGKTFSVRNKQCSQRILTHEPSKNSLVIAVLLESAHNIPMALYGLAVFELLRRRALWPFLFFVSHHAPS